MTRRRRNGNGNGNGSVLNAGTWINVLSIPLLTGGLTIGGFYYLTNYRLNQNAEDIKIEIAERQKTANEFFKQMQALNDGLAKLNTNVAVQASVLDQIKLTLAQRR